MTPLPEFHRQIDLDGKTHINVYSQGVTALGRALSHFAQTPFEHPELGFFTSVEGLWYFLRTRDESLRDLSGFEAKKIGRELPLAHPQLPDAEFRRLINLGNEAKICQNPALLDALGATTLPLTHYYVTKGYGSKPKESEWILAHLETIRSTLNPQADASNTAYLEAKHREVEQESQMQGSLF
ncbi:hypothetical protein IFT48_01770 [Pseudomonas fluorescens]|uniref:hypothetical protein n=1 Tax=Pseudomonas TaxID=286 RepID=UPI000F01BCE3|nr:MULTISPECIES: hypothetical protein [Pseudomonas]MBD8088689.1 hypothetical protein [Pseudomonas fluorescens]MBD8614850.1 hypothetical protein [Pseudomonas putida]MBD8681466.1 hypothetical protein [Pseudomonas sp. CFBP 13719]